jgi:O-antigen ligase
MWGIFIVAVFDLPKYREAQLSPLKWLIAYLQFWEWRRPLFLGSEKRAILPIGLLTGERRGILRKQAVFVAMTMPFWVVLVSGLWSEDLTYWLSRVRLRLPFLILPMAFAFFSSHFPSVSPKGSPLGSKKQISMLFFFLMLVVGLNLVLVLVNYAFDFQRITKLLGQGIHMPFLKDHITFSVLLAFAVLVGIEFWLGKGRAESRAMGVAAYMPALTVFLFIGLHVISVRMGLIAVYGCLILRGGFFIFETGRYTVGILGFLILSAIPLAAYRFIPSLQMRVNYAIWDWQQYQQSNSDNYSDSERMISYVLGWEIVKANPILGIGAGDIPQEMTRLNRQKQLPDLDFKHPFNQWLVTAASTGLVGLVISLWAFFYPLFKDRYYRRPLFLSIHVAFLAYTMADVPWEGTFALSAFAFFASLLASNQDFQS